MMTIKLLPNNNNNLIRKERDLIIKTTKVIATISLTIKTEIKETISINRDLVEDIITGKIKLKVAVIKIKNRASKIKKEIKIMKIDFKRTTAIIMETIISRESREMTKKVIKTITKTNKMVKSLTSKRISIKTIKTITTETIIRDIIINITKILMLMTMMKMEIIKTEIKEISSVSPLNFQLYLLTIL